MRVVLQRVREAEVTVGGASVGRIGRGLVILGGLAVHDREETVRWMARKIASLRIFDDGTGAQERSVVEASAEVLAVSQFTVVADCRKGRRPSYDDAMPAGKAAGLFEHFVTALRGEVGSVTTGRFGATMHVRLVNDGPLTLVIDSPASPVAR
jgi:D-tyrosyl-tRNA(Tyr) deacylase